MFKLKLRLTLEKKNVPGPETPQTDPRADSESASCILANLAALSIAPAWGGKKSLYIVIDHSIDNSNSPESTIVTITCSYKLSPIFLY